MQEVPPLNVLISLHKGYGLGDAVQMSSVLRHISKYRPHWRVDYQAEEGKHQVGRGLVANTFAYGEPYPSPHYDAEVQILLYDTWANWHDRPNTRVSSCLHERFGLAWDHECAKYQVLVSDETRKMVLSLMPPYCYQGKYISYHKPLSTRYVAVHYEGDSSPTKKNLTQDQAMAICVEIEKLGYMPLLIDWRNKSKIPSMLDIRSTGRHKELVDGWGGNAEINCALISHCKAFVGIDSGPGKCASATDTPTLIIWTGHHPAPFHDPAYNTTHLVPVGYHGLEPVCNDPDVIEWFTRHYKVRQYRDLVTETKQWLKGTLQ